MAEESSGVKEQAGAVAGTAAEQASNVASTATDQAKEVAGQAVAQASTVVTEAKTQVKDLVGQAGGELRSQGDAQTEKLAESLRGLAGQVQALVEGRPEEAGPLPDLARQATDQLQSLASRMGDGGIQGVAGELQTFARRRPGAFLAGAAVVGFAAGRLLRGAQAASSEAAPAPQPSPAGMPAPPAPLPATGDAYAGATADRTEVVVLEQTPGMPGTTGLTPTSAPGAMR